jgi:hypothetical protein
MIASGSICLGTLIGALVGWFINEAKEMNFRVLSSSVAIFTGGGVVVLFAFLSKQSSHEIWLYPVGLLLGFVIVTVVEIVQYGYQGNIHNSQQAMDMRAASEANAIRPSSAAVDTSRST